MASFADLLSSIGGQSRRTPGPAPSNPPGTTSGLQPHINAQRQAPVQTIAASVGSLSSNPPVPMGIKRKPEDQATSSVQKAARFTERVVPARASPHSSFNPPTSQPRSASPANPASAYRGTAKTNASANPSRNVPTPVPNSTIIATPSSQTHTNGTQKAARGFAATLAKAQAAAEAAKAAGSSGIKHRAVEKRTGRDRKRMRLEHRSNQEGAKAGSVAQASRSRSGTPANAGDIGKMKARMKKAAQPLLYKGTMRAADPAAPRPKVALKKGQGQDKYGGYASWSELSDAEDEDDVEEDYDSEGSSDMEGNYNDMEREETAALRLAQEEDRKALAEEERHKNEKLERKRKLQELSKSAAARKKY